MRLLIMICAVLMTDLCLAQRTDSMQLRFIVNQIMKEGAAYENLRKLCQNGPRLSGSEQAAKAVDISYRMLKESGADSVWLQPCMVPRWVRGAKETGYIQMADGTNYQLRLAALGNSEGSNGKPVCADVLVVESMQELDNIGEKGIRGKIVFFNLPMDPTHVRTFRAYGESGIARRSGPSQAAKYGAIGVMVRSLASNVDIYPHTGATQYNDSFPKIPAVSVSTVDAEWISSQYNKGTLLKACFQTSSRMEAEVLSYNVIGEIRGSVHPEEIITVGGHLDSWDLSHGAHDDGAGCMQSVEIIRTFKQLRIRPKRTIRAVLFMNEENGTKGAKAYLDSAISRQEQHVFALESDAGGFSPRGFSFDVQDAVFARLQTWLPLFREYGVYEFNRGGSGSDIAPLKKLGTSLAGLQPDSQRYFDLHHAATDVFETVSPRELHLGAAVMAGITWLVSEYGL